MNKFRKLLIGGALLLAGTSTKAQGLEGVVVEEYYTITTADAAFLAGLGNFDVAAGAKVYRVFVDMAPNYKLNTITGSPLPQGGGASPNPLDFTTTTFFWNDISNGSEVPAQTARLDEGAAFDSYITIGRSGVSGGQAQCGSNAQQLGVIKTADTNGNLTLCTSYSGWPTTGAGGNPDGNIPGTGINLSYNLGNNQNGSVFSLNTLTGVDESSNPVSSGLFQVIGDGWATLPNGPGVDPTGTNRVFIGQFTTDGTFSFHLNVQLQSAGGVLETYVWNQAAAGEVVSPFLTYPQPVQNDCLGVPGGPALPGTACNDNNACTTNDIWSAGCVCVGDAVSAPIINTSGSNSPVCAGQQLNLNAAATGAGTITYGWTGPNNFSSTQQNPSISGATTAATGAYIVTATGCGSAQATVNVVVNAAPSATISYPGSPFCNTVGSTPVVLTGTTGGTFSSTAGLSINAGTGAIDPSSSTAAQYLVTYTVAAAGGCSIFTTTASVTINAATTYYQDQDGDTFGDPASTQSACSAPVGYVTNNTDNCPTLFGKIGDTCNDGNAGTVNDVITANCVCAGTQPNDCLGVPGGTAQPGTACNDNDASTGNDTWNANCVCVGQTLDCLGVPGGAATIGSTCDDGSATTGNDVYNANCVCAGQTIDCLGVPGGTTLPGTACDDGNANSTNDVYGTNCVCAGTLANDCLGVPGGPAQPGTACNDGNANTGNDVYNANCVCVGQIIDCLGVPGGTTLPGTACDDGNASSTNDVYGANCVCAGTLANDCLGVPGGPAQPGTACNDGNVNTGNDVYGANCVCAGQLIDCLGVPGGNATIGSTCNDGNANTINDVYDANCVCSGVPAGDCTENLTLSIKLDAFGGQTTWILYDATETTIVDQGGPYTDGQPGVTVNEPICVAAGCYHLKVLDAGGNGITNGGYVLRDASNNRIIDATGTFTAVSQINQVPNQRDFCVPVGTLAMKANWCDRTNLLVQSPIYCNTYAGATGYQFWIFDPHGTYNRLVLKTTASFVPSSLTTNPVPVNKNLNVRVRPLVGGNYLPFGPACRVRFVPNNGSLSALAMDEVGGTTLEIYPNPTHDGRVTVRMEGLDVETETAVTIDVIDLLGMRVHAEQAVAAEGTLNHTLDLTNGLGRGMYLVNVTVNGNRFTQRLVLE